MPSECCLVALLAGVPKGERGPHLVVAPTSILENWRREVEQWCPSLRVLVYSGSEAERAALREDVRACAVGFEVVICSYAPASPREHARAPCPQRPSPTSSAAPLWHSPLSARAAPSACVHRYGLFSASTDAAKRERSWLGKLVKPGYLVLDEAQQIKNANSARYKALSELRCSRRLLLTGTPVENSPQELLALLGFLMPALFSMDADKAADPDPKVRARPRSTPSEGRLIAS